MFRSTTVGLAIMLAVSARAEAQDWHTVTSARQYRNEEVLDVSVEYGAGKLFVTPGDAGGLYKATLRYDADTFQPLTRYENGELRIGIEGGSIRGRNMKSGQLNLALGTGPALDLDLKFGAAEADIQLGGLRVRDVHIQTGASETMLGVNSLNRERCSTFKLEVGAANFMATDLGNLNCSDFDIDGGVGDVTLDFNGAWQSDADVKVDMGLGQLTLRLPRGLGVMVHKGGFLASFDSQGLIKRGDVYYSENWESASNRVSFNIDAAFGSIRIQWVEPNASFRRAQR